MYYFHGIFVIKFISVNSISLIFSFFLTDPHAEPDITNGASEYIGHLTEHD